MTTGGRAGHLARAGSGRRCGARRGGRALGAGVRARSHARRGRRGWRMKPRRRRRAARCSAAGRAVDHRANGFDPTEILRDFDYGRTSPAAERAHGARVGGRRHRQGDRGRAGRPVPGVDVQRPDPRADAPLPRRATCSACASSTAPSTRTRCTSTGSTRPRWTASPVLGARRDPARREHRLRVRGRAVRAAPLPLPRRAAGGAHRPRDVRHLHRRPAPGPAARRRDGDGPARLQHDLRRPRATSSTRSTASRSTTRATPIQVRRGELVRIYLVNILEYDPINSFHVHGNFFHYYPTGTRLEPVEFTDTIVQGQGQRGICELRFPHAGRLHVPRPQDRVRRARLDGLLRGGRSVTRGRARAAPTCAGRIEAWSARVALARGSAPWRSSPAP